MADLIYLASPYSDPDPDVREARFQAVLREAGRLMASGLFVFSPILHCHPMAVQAALPKAWGFWSRYDLEMLRRCDRIAVLKLDGWERSVGVQAEIVAAHEQGKPVGYLEPGGEIEW